MYDESLFIKWREGKLLNAPSDKELAQWVEALGICTKFSERPCRPTAKVVPLDSTHRGAIFSFNYPVLDRTCAAVEVDSNLGDGIA